MELENIAYFKHILDLAPPDSLELRPKKKRAGGAMIVSRLLQTHFPVTIPEIDM
jgi:hypothetical protein